VLLAVGVAGMGPLLWWLTVPEPPSAAPSGPAAAPDLAPVAVSTPQPAGPAIDSPQSTAPQAGPQGPSPGSAASSPLRLQARVREPGSDPTPDLADYLNPGEAPSMAEVIARLHAAGVRSGLGAFNPPGTRPPLVGLAVPEDFELPPGYVRHHQATDDGQRIEAILMFAPDLQLVDRAGRPVPMPADRVVPPELAPPGLPIRRIAVPAPVPPGR
jgi:hypothetical protein